MSNLECALSVGSNTETVVSPATYKPDNDTFCVGQHQLELLVNGGDLRIGEVVAHQLRAFHAERMETVTRLNRSDGHGEYDFVSIERSTFGIA